VLGADAGQVELNVTIGPDAGQSSRQPTQRIHAWSMRSRATGTLAELRWLREGEHAYELSYGEERVRGDIEFDGLVPLRAVGDLRTRLAATGLPVLDTAPRLPPIAHLGPFREPLHAYYPMPGLPVTNVGVRGEHAAAVLGSREASSHGKTFERVAQWFSQHLNLDLQLSELGAEGSELGIVLKVRPSGRSTWINISSAGTGTMHVLPYVVQHALASDPEAQDTAPEIIACEEPEAHLHPAAQAGLADLAVETALAGKARVLVETHSENLLLRVRRHVAEKRISPDQVGIYWVDDEGGQTTLRRLDIEPDGWVADWPDGIFAEAAAEARAIGRANRDQPAPRPRSGDEG